MFVEKENWVPFDGINLEENALKSIKCEENVLVEAGPGAGKTELLAQKANYICTTGMLNRNKKILAISFKKDSAANLEERFLKRTHGFDESFLSLTYDSFFKSIYDQFMCGITGEYVFPDYEIDNDYEITKNVINEIYGPLKKSVLKRYLDAYEKNKENAISEYDEYGKEIFTKKVEKSPVLTFSEIGSIVYELLTLNPMISRAIQNSFQFVFLDEFQDTTVMQYKIVKLLFENSDTVLTAVGDTNQRIMLWAGADSKVFNKFEKDFYARRFSLIMNHRSVPLLIEFQKNVYSTILEGKEVKSCLDEDKGDLALFEFCDETSEIDKVLSIIDEKIKNGCKSRDICIIVKQLPENYCEKLINEAHNRNIGMRIETDYQDLLKENLTNLIISMIRLMFASGCTDDWQEICSFYNKVSSKMNYNLFDKKIKSIKDDYNNDRSIKKLIIKIVDLLGEDSLRKVFPEYTKTSYIKQCSDKLIKVFEKDFKDDLLTTIKVIEGEFSIPVMTIHKSKGLEYNTVIFWGLDDKAFWNYKNQPMEDRCAFFVALSRAKENLYFTFNTIRFGENRTHNEINEMYNLLLNYRRD